MLGEFFIYNSLNFFSLIILGILYFHNSYSYNQRFAIIWRKVLLIAFTTQLLEILRWYVQVYSGNLSITLAYITNILLYTLFTILSMQVAIFIYYIVKGATKNLHKIKKAFKFIVLINFLFLLLTPVFKYAFYITQNNQFVTGNLYFVMVLLMMLPLLLVLFTLLYNYTSTSFLNSRVVALILFLTLSIIMTTAYLQLEYTFEMSAILPVITVTLFILHLMLVSKVITQDHLTKVQNKLGLEAYMSQLYKTINYYTAVIFFDLDEFKELNDKYGHKKGDEALSEFAKILYNETKNKDTVARIGGDEFLVILLADKMEQIDVYIKSVKEHINKYNKQKDNVKLKYSYGVSIKKPGEALKKEDLISQADKEMYKNKHS